MFGISRRRWHADPDKIRGLLFPRSTDMLDFLDGLVRRTRLFFRKEKTLPIVCFYRVWPDESPIKGVEDRLRGQPRVAISKVTEPAGESSHPDDSEEHEQRIPKLAEFAPLRALLDHIVKDFSGDFLHVRPLRFPHYALACWLLFLAERGFRATPRTESHTPA